MYGGSRRISLVTEKSKIMVGKTMTKFSTTIKILIVYGIIQLLNKFGWIKLMSLETFLVLMLLLLIMPFALHMLYISLTKFGYAVFYDDQAKICTKTSTTYLGYGNSLKLDIKGHCLFVRKPQPDYYSVKLIFEENGEIKKIHLLTDDINSFRPLLAKFKKPD